MQSIDYGGVVHYERFSGSALGERAVPSHVVEGEQLPENGDAELLVLDETNGHPAEIGAVLDGEPVEQEAAAGQPRTAAAQLPAVRAVEFIDLPDSPPRAGAEAALPLPSKWDAAARSGGQASASGRAEGDLPWATASSRIYSPLLRLHTEIVEFCRFLEPTEAERVAREEATQRVADVITAIWRTAEVKIFGSFVTGLYLPTSDIDLVVINSGARDIPTALKAISSSLMRKSMAKNVQVIAKAKVPIIKFQEVASGIMFDVSFDVANGPEAAQNVRDLMHALPPMKPLVLVMKIFLQQREFNEVVLCRLQVYLGGIGSYALLVMVASFLLLHPSRLASSDDYYQVAGELEPSLGVLLVDFLRLFGRTLNVDAVAVSCARGGEFVAKRAVRALQSDRPQMLAVQDPGDEDNDLSKGSWNLPKIQQAFDFAYQQLTAASTAGESLLARIIRLDAVLTERAAPPDDAPAMEQLEARWEQQAEGQQQQQQPRSEHGHSSGRRKATKRRRERECSEDGQLSGRSHSEEKAMARQDSSPEEADRKRHRRHGDGKDGAGRDSRRHGRKHRHHHHKHHRG